MTMEKPAVAEKYPLQWPEGWPRTFIGDRREAGAWKKNINDSRENLLRELAKMGATNVVMSTNVPENMRGGLQSGIEPKDPAVAMYFTLKPTDDFSWQKVLGIDDPAPTLAQIDSAYKERARKYHPDNQVTGDAKMFTTLAAAAAKARDWVTGKTDSAHQYVIACDLFKQVRWNITSIRLTIAALRQIERCGATSVLERAFKGFSALPATGETSSGKTQA